MTMKKSIKSHTSKKALLEPASRVPYLIRVCLRRSSADLIGVSIRSTVRKAAKLAVYVEISISVKNHHELPAIRPDKDLYTRHNISCTRSLISDHGAASFKHSLLSVDVDVCNSVCG